MQGRLKTMLVLAGILIVLVIIAVLSNQARQRARSPGEPLYPGFAAEQAERIILEKGDDRVELHKNEEGVWLVATEGDYPADETKVDRVLENIPDFHTRDLVSRNPDKQETFEVTDSLGTKVTVLGSGGTELAHFLVGKQGPGFMSTYVRPAGENTVLLVPKYMRSNYDVNQPTWRDKSIFEFGVDEATRVEILPAEGDSLLVVKGDADAWSIVEPDTFPVKETIWQSMLRSASTLKTDAFADSVPDTVDTGLTPPQQVLRIEMADGRELVLHIGHTDDKNRHYVSKMDDPTIFLLSKGRVSNLMKTLDALKAEPGEEPQMPPGMPPGMKPPGEG
ncbi:MAG: DUF4340 domain-containing protein [Candidatus Eisenbacteria bacterium]|nr:DUF4340 domain-containing protein [Candidatus Eisenbacteria bacterium]